MDNKKLIKNIKEEIMLFAYEYMYFDLKKMQKLNKVWEVIEENI